jgi:quinol monooxygenase YgiN
MSTTGNIVVNARWQVSSEALSEVLALLPAVREKTLAEPGCLGYEVFQSVNEPTRLLLVEHYRDAAAVEAHRATSHYQQLVVGRIIPLLQERKVELLQARGPV